MAMPLHRYFYRTIGPAVYGGGVATVVDTNWAEELALLLDPAEESVWVFDFTQESMFNDNAAAPAKDKNNKKAKGGPWTSNSTDYIGYGAGLYKWVRTIVQYGQVFSLGPTGKFICGPVNDTIQRAPTTIASGLSSSTDSEVAPDGDTPALMTVQPTGSAYLNMSIFTNTVNPVEGGYYIDWYVKNIDQDYVQLYISPASYVNFDIANGTKGTYGGDAGSDDYSITLITDGYYRLRWYRPHGTNRGAGIIAVDSASATYAAAAAVRGGQFYYWRCSAFPSFAVDDYYYPWYGDTQFGHQLIIPNHNASGDVLGITGSIQGWACVGTYSGASLTASQGGKFNIADQAGFTKSNITATYGEDCPITDKDGNDIAIANLITVSSAGGTGTATVTYPSGGSLATTPRYSFVLVKPGTATCMYWDITGAHVGDGSSTYRMYYDFSSGLATYEEDHGTAIGDVSPSWSQYSQLSMYHSITSGHLCRISDDWWVLMFQGRGTQISSTSATMKFGICDAVGSTTCSLNGQYLTLLPFQEFYEGTNATTQGGPGIPVGNPWADNFNIYQRIYLDGDLEVDVNNFTTYVEFMHPASLYAATMFSTDGSGSYPSFWYYSAAPYFYGSSTLAKTNWGTDLDISTNIPSGSPASAPTRWAMSCQANDLFGTVDGYQSISPDTSGSVPGSYTYWKNYSMLLRRFANFNRACTEADTEALTSAKIPSDLDTLKASSVVVDVLCEDWPGTQLEAGLVQVQVLRSTSGS
jgi:hypothetical protein